MMENRSFTQVHHENSVDTTDNACSNGTKYFKSSKYLTSSVINKSSLTTTITTTENESTEMKSKSFIQQRVERLYGPGALAQGFYSPKKIRSHNENSVLCERSPNTQNKYAKTIKTTYVTQDDHRHNGSNIINTKTSITTNNHFDNNSSEENFENLRNCDDLPVLRHLRPEFRAQLPILSPKRSLTTTTTTTAATTTMTSTMTGTTTTKMTNIDRSPALVNGKSYYMNGDEKSSTSSQSIVISSSIKNNDVVLINNNNNNNNIILANGVNHKSVDQDQKEIILNPPLSATTTTISQSINDMKISEKNLDKSDICDNNKSMNESKLYTSSSLSSPPAPTLPLIPLQPININEKLNSEMLTTISTSTIPTSNKIYIEEKENQPAEVEHDGNYFLKLLKIKQDRLIDLAVEAEKEMDLLTNSDVSDEIFGYLRSASGKARLLASQKMKQFEGLCRNNLNQLPDEKFPTTNEDLQGFWDMVMLQVDHVELLFKEIEHLKQNNWQKPTQISPVAPQGSKLTRRPNPQKILANTSNASNGTKVLMTNGASSKKSTASQLAAQKREAQRKQLMELKRKNKMAITAEQQKQQNSSKVEIFVNEPCNS